MVSHCIASAFCWIVHTSFLLLEGLAVRQSRADDTQGGTLTFVFPWLLSFLAKDRKLLVGHGFVDIVVLLHLTKMKPQCQPIHFPTPTAALSLHLQLSSSSHLFLIKSTLISSPLQLLRRLNNLVRHPELATGVVVRARLLDELGKVARPLVEDQR
jgi:hypothetical protein